jgi:YHS domain-containing protein
MNSIDTLMGRIDQEIAAEVGRQKADWAAIVQITRARAERVEHYQSVARHIVELLRPRLDAFAQCYKPLVKIEPLMSAQTYAINLSFAATVAKVTLRFEMFADKDVTQVRLQCSQEIIPVLFDYERQSALDFRLDAVQDDAVVGWFDDRLVAFVKSYIAIVRQDAALQVLLKDHMVEDPVAKIRFPKHLAAFTLERDGQTYYFVDEDTRRQFDQQSAAT